MTTGGDRRQARACAELRWSLATSVRNGPRGPRRVQGIGMVVDGTDGRIADMAAGVVGRDAGRSQRGKELRARRELREAREAADLIGEIYAAVLDPTLWADVLKRVAHFISGPAAP